MLSCGFLRIKFLLFIDHPRKLYTAKISACTVCFCASFAYVIKIMFLYAHNRVCICMYCTTSILHRCLLSVAHARLNLHTEVHM